MTVDDASPAGVIYFFDWFPPVKVKSFALWLQVFALEGHANASLARAAAHAHQFVYVVSSKVDPRDWAMYRDAIPADRRDQVHLLVLAAEGDSNSSRAHTDSFLTTTFNGQDKSGAWAATAAVAKNIAAKASRES